MPCCVLGCIYNVLTESTYNGGTDGKVCLYVHVCVALLHDCGSWSMAVVLWQPLECLIGAITDS